LTTVNPKNEWTLTNYGTTNMLFAWGTIMSIELIKEETENLLLIAIGYLQQNSNYPENDVGLKLLASNTNMKLSDVKNMCKS